MLTVVAVASVSCAINTSETRFTPPQPASTAGAPKIQVLTQHNNNARTGANLEEEILTTATVRPGQFGFLASRTVDGQIYAQPLYVPGVVFSDRTYNVVYVATMHNSVYAFDADNVSDSPGDDRPLWQVNLGTSLDYDFFPMKYWIFGKYNISPEIGILSTPVIDAQAGTIYVTAKVRTPASEGGRVVYRLHALDIVTGDDRPHSPVEIGAKVPGLGDGSRDGMVLFEPVHQLQRPGLLLVKGAVYLTFASHQDTRPFHGWIFAYDAKSLNQIAVYCSSCTTAGEGESGIWQAGSGPAADDDGNVYVMTGNGWWDPTTEEFGSSFVKLSPTLSVLDWFTPANYKCLNHVDADLGSAGPLLIPGTRFLVGGGKEGVVFLLDRNQLGHLQPSGSTQSAEPCTDEKVGTGPPPLYSFQATPPWKRPTNILVLIMEALFPDRKSWDYHHIHGSPVFWDSASGPLLYIWGERDFLRAFRLDPATTTFPGTNKPGAAPQSTYWSAFPSGNGMPGAALSLSANGSDSTSAIIWASLPLAKDALTDVVPGVLRAFRAEPAHPEECLKGGDLTKCELEELWNTKRDDPLYQGEFNFAKYSPPTIANGKVYLPTFSKKLNIYGLLKKGSREIRRQSLPTAGVAADLASATFVSQVSPPLSMRVGDIATVSVTMRNDGKVTWTPEHDYGLMGQNPPGNVGWHRDGIVRLSATVQPGATHTFNFVVTAKREGFFPYQWRLTGNGRSFGDETPYLVISVKSEGCASVRTQQRVLREQIKRADDDERRNRGPRLQAAVTQLSLLSEKARSLGCAVKGDVTFPPQDD